MRSSEVIPIFSHFWTRKTVQWADFRIQIHSIGFLCNNPNWHEAGRIYPPYNFKIGFCQLNFIKNFQILFEVKIEIKRDNLTPCQAH